MNRRKRKTNKRGTRYPTQEARATCTTVTRGRRYFSMCKLPRQDIVLSSNNNNNNNPHHHHHHHHHHHQRQHHHRLHHQHEINLPTLTIEANPVVHFITTTHSLHQTEMVKLKSGRRTLSMLVLWATTGLRFYFQCERQQLYRLCGTSASLTFS